MNPPDGEQDKEHKSYFFCVTKSNSFYNNRGVCNILAKISSAKLKEHFSIF